MKIGTLFAVSVTICTCVAVAGLTAVTLFQVTSSSDATTKNSLYSATRVATDLFVASAPNTEITEDADGNVEAIITARIANYRNNSFIESVASTVGEEVTIFVYDEETDSYVTKTTSLVDAQDAVIEETYASDSAEVKGFASGKAYDREEVLAGDTYRSRLVPMVNPDGTPMGILRVSANLAASRAEADELRMSMLIAGGAMALLAVVLSLLMARAVTTPIRRLTKTMRTLADGDLENEIKGTDTRNELGEMARTVEVFRENAIRVRDMTEEEAARIERTRTERVEMMQDLQQAFGEVVDAAIAGDFSQRVTTEFPDEELNALARSVNDLVETVDRGLEESGEVLSSLAHTDLTQRVRGEYRGAFDKLKRDTNAVADKLVEIVGQLKQTSRGLKTATGEILSGANDLSERTTKQAATIEETSAAMEQLAHTVMGNAKRAGSASDQARKASNTAEEGGEVMAEANHAMERISQSSAKISNIIGMIDDIAFQTNLLALNASVEAARAGEAGKGFAVVAIEVRRLAQSAAEASSEVKTLIEQSGEEVAGGTRLVASAAEKLSAILDAVRTNAVEMEAIARDSQEQAGAIEEVNVAVRQMDEMTQHNAALVEETNAAIEQTEAQASELDRIVEVFTLEDTASRAHAA